MRTMLLAAAGARKKEVVPDLEYFGTELLITGVALASLVGMTAGTSINSPVGFMKFARKGKELFVATRPLRSSISWNQLNAINVITGNKVVEINGVSYKVRLLTGGNGDPSSAAGGEWNELMYAVCSGRPASYVGPKLAELSETTLWIGDGSNIRSTLCQETQGGVPANCIRRGRDNTQYYAGLPKTDNGTTVYWRPVLERVYP